MIEGEVEVLGRCVAGSQAPRAEAKERPTYHARLVSASQATPTGTAEAAPPD